MEPFPSYYEIPMEQQSHTLTPGEGLVGQQEINHADGQFQPSQHEAGADVHMQRTSSTNAPYHHARLATSLPAGSRFLPHAGGGQPVTPPRHYEGEYDPRHQSHREHRQHRQHHTFLPGLPERITHPGRSQYDDPHNYKTQDDESPSQTDNSELPLLSSEVADLFQPATPVCPRQPAVGPSSAQALSTGSPTQKDPADNSPCSHRQRRLTKKEQKALPWEEQAKYKQEAYRQKGALKRQQIQERKQRDKATVTTPTAKVSDMVVTPPGPPARSNKKRKANNKIVSRVPPTPPPNLRGGHHDAGLMGHTNLPDWYGANITDQMIRSDGTQAEHYADVSPFGRSSPYTPHSVRQSELFSSPCDRARKPPTTPRYDWDAVPQPITLKYQEYKWSVIHYSLDPSHNFPYAQCFLDALTQNTLVNEPKTYKWASHSTRGFIKDGSRFSLLVLHNAANPFTWDSPYDTTTTVGVYGRYWYEHEEIHWVTFCPGIADILAVAQQQGFITQIQTWQFDMPANDKRFHRAYWLAANMLSLGGLLGRGGDKEDDSDAPDIPFEDDFQVSEEDLQSAWDEGVTDVSLDKASELWERLLEDLEFTEVPEGGWEHIPTWGTEMEY